jgi:low affinity Fe/Cu permease
MQQTSWFTRFAKKTAQLSGRPAAFCLALATIIAWLVTGPIFGFSDTWQLIINTGTTIVTFLMVFLLGNASNRITENQDRLLEGIYGEEHQLDQEERLILKLLARMDVQHIRPILKHLDEQDHQIEQLEQRILDALREIGRSA